MACFISVCLTVIATGIFAMIIYTINPLMCGKSVTLPSYLFLLLEKTLSVDAFITYFIRAMAVSVLGILLFQISNHIMISLDILYLFSMLMLILYHSFKKAGLNLCK